MVSETKPSLTYQNIPLSSNGIEHFDSKDSPHEITIAYNKCT